MRSRRGSASLEFALSLPVLMAIIGGVVDFGWFLDRRLVLVELVGDAASAGARTRVIDGPEGVASARIAESLAAAGFDADMSTVSATTDSDETIGNVLILAVSVPYEALVGLFSFADTFEVTAQVRLEDQ